MRAIIVREPGGIENLFTGEWEKPVPADTEILVKVKAAGVNRADILQRKGKYPPPKGASELLGLEIAGNVVETGKKCTRWKPGDQVMSLIPGGGYAEYAVIHEEMAMPVPSHFSYEEAAAIPEAFLTAFHALVWTARIQKQERALIHAGGSGVGTAAIQIAKSFDAEVFITASAGKHSLCRLLGADHAIDYRSEQFDEYIKTISGGKGVNIIVDFIGGPYLSANIDSLSVDGRMVMLALIGSGPVREIDLRKIIGKRLSITGSTLRSRSPEYLIRLNREFANYALPLFDKGTLKPVVDKIFDWADVAEAHTYMEENRNTGKIILKIAD